MIIGREFELNPKLLLVSQPTRGVDIGAIEFIHRKLIALRDAGSAVLLVSAELEEVTALADRLLVIYKGKFVGEVNPKMTSNEEIGLLMTGGKVIIFATKNTKLHNKFFRINSCNSCNSWLIFLFVLAKIKIQTDSDDIIYRQKSVCNCKNPIADPVTVNRKSD